MSKRLPVIQKILREPPKYKLSGPEYNHLTPNEKTRSKWQVWYDIDALAKAIDEYIGKLIEKS